MSEAKIEMKMLLIPHDLVMDGFCYAYCEALLNKLKKLVEENKVLEGSVISRDACSNPLQYLPPIAESVVTELCAQIGLGRPESVTSERYVGDLIATATEFLAIFEKE